MSRPVAGIVWSVPRKAPFIQETVKISPWGNISAYTNPMDMQIRFTVFHPILFDCMDRMGIERRDRPWVERP